MEGHLYKWAGYFTGWVERYCTISNGQLELYQSKEALESGSPIIESHHVALCEIVVDKNTNTHWEMRTPVGVNVFYKTDTKEERQRWLKILGSVKACMMDTSSLSHLLKPASPASNDHHISTDESKKHNLQNGAHDIERVSKIDTNSEEPVEQNNIDTSEKSLDEIILSEKEEGNDLKEKLNVLCELLISEIHSLQLTAQSDESQDAIHRGANKVIELFVQFGGIVSKLTGKPLDIGTAADGDDVVNQHSDSTTDGVIDTSNQELALSQSQSHKPVHKIKTFFSIDGNSFEEVIIDAERHSDPNLLCSVQTETYLRVCSNYTLFFDVFGGTLFTPLKSDMLSNAEKIRKAVQKNPARSVLLQQVIEDEITNNEHKHPDSATQAILWMMRGLRTIAGFFRHSVTPGGDGYKVTPTALDAAYRECLKRHHNFLVQKLFVMGIKLLPSFEDMIQKITIDKIQPNDEEEEDIVQQIRVYSDNMSAAVKLIEKIYIHHQIAL